jgi:hypothetical protein
MLKTVVGAVVVAFAVSGVAEAQVSTAPSGASGGGSDRPTATGSGSTVSGSNAMTPGTAATTGAVTTDPRDRSSAGSSGSPVNTENTFGNPPPPKPAPK